MSAPSSRWMHSPAFDLTLIIGPPFLCALAVLLLPALHVYDTPDWGYFAFVICIDIGHVFASVYRLYFDSTEFRRRPVLYGGVPLLCWGIGVLLYGVSRMTFWRAFVYLGIFHVIRQQYGFMRIYQYLHRERSRLDEWIDKIAIYATMVYPLAYWHADPKRMFSWDVAGDLFKINALFAPAVGWIYGAALGIFCMRQLWIWAQGRSLNWGKIGIMASTAFCWYVGIVALNSDFAFTITNVVSHGVPYYAVVWLYGRRKWASSGSWLEWIHRPAPQAVAAFVGLMILFAYIDDGLWSTTIRDHPSVFLGNLIFHFKVSSSARMFIEPLLGVPSAAHYVLDAWLWKMDGSNPGLGYYLLGEGSRPARAS